jgi:hypothetical protein
METQGTDGMKVIEANTEFLVALPWNGVFGLFMIRMLNATQIRACGNFSTIMLDDDEPRKEQSLDDLIELKRMHEALAKYALVKPTYKEIYDYLGVTDHVKRIKQNIKETRELIKTLEDPAEVDDLVKELDAGELFLEFMIPDDFLSALTAIIIQRDNTDIRRVTRDMLLEWAVLAERGHNNPSDHAEGMFTATQLQDIDKYGWIELAEYREREAMVNNSKKTWVRGKGKKRRS